LADLVKPGLETSPLVPEDLLALGVARAGDNAANLGDRHVHRAQQGDHASRTGLTGAVVPVPRISGSRRGL
jgi:hypothetical protein